MPPSAASTGSLSSDLWQGVARIGSMMTRTNRGVCAPPTLELWRFRRISRVAARWGRACLSRSMQRPEPRPERGEFNLLGNFTGTVHGTCALHTLQVRRLSVLAGPDEPRRIPARGACALVRETQVRRELAGGVDLLV